ncbi:MAG: hypothetical protein P4L87_16280 [Formivibrio sp.]|nr:hypothetical protein [Formivibrio sp.]
MHIYEKYYFKELGWLLLVKICLIIAIRFLFFGHPHSKPDSETVSAHLLGASAPAAVSPLPENSKNRRSYDQ